jgi:hypothetical protein
VEPLDRGKRVKVEEAIARLLQAVAATARCSKRPFLSKILHLIF